MQSHRFNEVGIIFRHGKIPVLTCFFSGASNDRDLFQHFHQPRKPIDKGLERLGLDKKKKTFMILIGFKKPVYQIRLHNLRAKIWKSKDYEKSKY
jgi:hypothetical protein